MGAEDVPKRERKPVNPDAYDAYLKAKIMYLESTNKPEQAIQLAEKVIELDPGFAPGYALLANLYGYLVLTSNPTHDNAYLRARKLARKAIELDPENPDARFAMARVHYRFEWDWAAAESEFKKGLELNPNDANGLNAYGVYRVLIHKDCDEGIALLEAARDRDPFSSGKHWDLGAFNFHCRRADESIKHMELTIEMTPGNYWARMFIVLNHLLNGSFGLATEGCDSLIDEVGQKFDSGLLASCAWVYSTAGQENLAKHILERLRKPPAGIHVDPVFISWTCFALDDLECGFQQLNESLRHHSPNMIFLRTAPVYDPVREDPRFLEVLDQMDFPS